MLVWKIYIYPPATGTYHNAEKWCYSRWVFNHLHCRGVTIFSETVLLFNGDGRVWEARWPVIGKTLSMHLVIWPDVEVGWPAGRNNINSRSTTAEPPLQRTCRHRSAKLPSSCLFFFFSLPLLLFYPLCARQQTTIEKCFFLGFLRKR